jgi:crossover junction endodeoxyribonuclease RuvC
MFGKEATTRPFVYCLHPRSAATRYTADRIKKLTDKKVILGIDPGTNLMGFGIISVQNKKPEIVDLGVFTLKSISDHFQKLQHIFNHTDKLIKNYNIDELAIEAQFFGKNVQSMLKLGRAQGVAISAALAHQLPVFEYAPRKIKMSITGRGDASKEQVASFLKSILGLKEIPENLDATDGLATALCHYYQTSRPQTETSYKSWKEFVNKNPRKIV